MLRVTLSQLRAHASRYVSVSLAVILAVAFMSATFLLNASTRETLRASLGADYQHATLVVQASGGEQLTGLDVAALERIRALPEVAAAHSDAGTTGAIQATGSEQAIVTVTSLPDASLRPVSLTDGAWPTGDGDVAIDQSTADLYGLTVGSTVPVSFFQLGEVPEGSDGTVTETLTVTGLTTSPNNPLTAGVSRGYVTDAGLARIAQDTGDDLVPTQVQVRAADGVTADRLRAALRSATAKLPVAQDSVLEFATPDEVVSQQVASFAGGSDVLTIVMLAFVAIALLVSALVVSNTYSVLVAQRTRELALLRCVGADRRQIRRSVLLEAALMALMASVLGVLLAFTVMAGLVAVANRAWSATGASVAFGMDASAIVWPIVVGVIVTVVAALIPARQATRVSPLAAMRPVEPQEGGAAGGRARLVFGLLTLVGGWGILLLGAGLGLVSPVGLLVAVFGAIVSAVGVLILAVFYVPGLTRLVGRLVGRLGVPARMAALNSVRNPRRTAATASALLIGVTLVATVYTGASVARATMANALDGSFPIDFVATSSTAAQSGDEAATGAVTDGQLADLRALEGVRDVEPILVDDTVDVGQGTTQTQVWGVDPDAYASVSRQAVDLAGGRAATDTVEAGGVLSLSGSAGSLDLEVASNDVSQGTVLVTRADFAKVSRVAADNGVLIRVADAGVSQQQLLQLSEQISSILPGMTVDGGVAQRVALDQVVQTLLLIVIGLLAVAILIALIGVGNTLSLSVIERRRESALLRALGLTRGQLRGMLAIEALLMALVAAVVGTVLGIGYGYLGAMSALGSLGGLPPLAVPWGALGVMLGVAALAGLLASVLPARRAAKASPVEGLAVS